LGTYARFRSDAQHPASIDDQRLACQRYVDQHGGVIATDHQYADEALSGMGVEHRPGYRRLLAAIASAVRPFDALLVDDLSRLSRDAAEILRRVRSLQVAGIKLISVADGIETGHKLSKLAVSMKADMNELYLDDLRDRTLRGLRGRFVRGMHTGGRTYGFRSVPVYDRAGRVTGDGHPLALGMTLEIDATEARMIDQIFRWFGNGVSLRGIAHRLNEQMIPFPAEPTRRGARRKGWASSGVRVLLLNEKYIGRFIFGRRVFVKDPLTGRCRAHLRPPEDWQVVEHPELRIIEQALWETVQAKFRRLGDLHRRERHNGRLNGRHVGAPTGRSSLFSGVLRCGVCEGNMVVVTGDRQRGRRRYGCGFHREKGSQVCANNLTVKIETIERTLLAAIREKVLNPAAVRYLVVGVNRHLERQAARAADQRRGLEQQLEHIEAELANIEKAILAGVVTDTTTALLKDREAQRQSLRARLQALDGQRAKGGRRVDDMLVAAQLAKLDDVLNEDAEAANAFSRQHVKIRCTPAERGGRRFYQAKGDADGTEIIKSLGLAQAFDFGGCEGWI
jgi:site-specific DNA recombinase